MYRIPVPLGTFIDDIILLISELPTQQRIWIVGDFNLDQILSQNVAKVDPLIQNFNLSQRSQYSTRVHGRLLDILLDTSNFKLFLLYHHPSMITLLFFPNLIIIIIRDSAFNNLAFNPHYITCADILLLKFDERFIENHWWKQSAK